MRRIHKLLIVLVAALSFMGCAKDVDWYPVDLDFRIQDSEGRDLLDPSSDLFIGGKLSLTYGGSEYPAMIPTKTYMPLFRGLIIVPDDGGYCARFGELDGGKNYDDDFIVNLPDGTTRTIHYDRKINFITISARQQWRLDGKKVDLPLVITY